MTGAVILQIILIALNAVFASAEIAVISMNDVKLERMAMKGDRRAKKLVELTSQPARFLATIQVAITLAGFLGSAYAADNFAGPLTKLLLGLGLAVPEAVLNKICVFAITLIIAYFSIVFGELIPSDEVCICDRKRKDERLCFCISARGLWCGHGMSSGSLIWTGLPGM